MITKGLCCVYKITYTGNKLPPYYIGSTYCQKLENGYLGTPTSQKYGKVWRDETKNNPHLFRVEILSLHDTREEAILAESIEQKSSFELGDILWVNQSYSTGGFISSSATARKAAETDRKRNDLSASRKKGHETRKKNGTDKTGSAKGVETKKKLGIPLGATKESAAKRKETIIKNGGAIGWTKESQAKGIETKRSKGTFKIAADLMAADAKKKSARSNVQELRRLSKKYGITLGRGWYKKSDDWVNMKIGELSSPILDK